MAAVFPARNFLRVIAVILAVLWVALISFIILISGLPSFQDFGPPEIGLMLFFIFVGSIPTIVIALFLNNSFSTLEIDEESVVIRKFVFGKRVMWKDMARLYCWRGFHMVAVETNIVIHGLQEQALLSLKTEFTQEALTLILTRASAKGVIIINSPPPWFK